MQLPNWRELVLLAAHREEGYRIIFNPPASENMLQEAEKILHITLPDDLKHFLLTFNGVGETIDSETSDSILFPMIYPLERIINENLSFRQNLEIQRSKNIARAENLLLFTDILTGDYIGFGMTDHGHSDGIILFYDHEVVATRPIAATLEEFFAVWAKGRI